jgi:arginyl-tRNA synthetase
MRVAQADLTLGVVAARQGDVERAVAHGRASLSAERKSLPSLVMVSRELATVLSTRYGSEAVVDDYIDEIRSITSRGTD